jgi:hypothetical protein
VLGALEQQRSLREDADAEAAAGCRVEAAVGDAVVAELSAAPPGSASPLRRREAADVGTAYLEGLVDARLQHDARVRLGWARGGEWQPAP